MSSLTVLFCHALLFVTIQEQSDAMITGQPGPKWVSWSYDQEHLSAKFHTNTDGFDHFLKWLKSMPYCNNAMVAYPQSRVLLVCLGIGMVLRDLQVIQFGLGEGNEDSSNSDAAIAHLRKSQLDWGHSKALLRICNTIVDNLNTCLGELEEPDPPTSGNKGKKPAPKRQRKLPQRYLSNCESIEICSSFILVAEAKSDDPQGISKQRWNFLAFGVV